MHLGTRRDDKPPIIPYIFSDQTDNRRIEFRGFQRNDRFAGNQSAIGCVVGSVGIGDAQTHRRRLAGGGVVNAEVNLLEIHRQRNPGRQGNFR